jgi:hypothetical protein
MISISQTAASIKLELQQKHFIIFGILLYDSFFSNEVASNGLVPSPNVASEKLQGGHCMNIIGWLMLNETLYFICRNSWGKGWGNNGSANPSLPFIFANDGSNGGCCYIPASYILNTNLTFELFSVW